MKSRGIAFISIVLLILVSSPVAAINKSDLISYYKCQTVPTSGTSGIIPPSVPPTIPTPAPATAPTLRSKSFYPIFPDSYEFRDSFLWCCGNDSRAIGPQPTPTFGSLEISSNPSGASVFLDVNPWTDEGTFIGTTPISISVKTGSHRLKLTKPGYSGARYIAPEYDITPLYGKNQIEVTVNEGKTVRVSVVLIPDYKLSKGGLS